MNVSVTPSSLLEVASHPLAEDHHHPELPMTKVQKSILPSLHRPDCTVFDTFTLIFHIRFIVVTFSGMNALQMQRFREIY